MKLWDVGTMLFLAAIWGLSFLLIRVAAPALGPIVLVNARMLIAGTALLLYSVIAKREQPSLRTLWKPLLALGALNSALPLTLEAFAVVHLNASMTAILATTAPLFTAALAAVWLNERLTPAKTGGLLLGLLGVGAVVGWSPIPITPAAFAALGAGLLAALLYGLAGVYTKRKFHETPVLPLTIGQELLAGALMLPLSLTQLPRELPALPVVVATLVLALVMTAGGNLLYFHLIARIGPTKTQSIAFLVPVVTLGAGVALLKEPFTHSMLLGLGVIIISVALVLELWPRRVARDGVRSYGRQAAAKPFGQECATC